MDRIQCATCGEEHDLHEIEPLFDRPDAYFDIPNGERLRRVWSAESLCVLFEFGSEPRRHFMRAVLPIPIRGEDGRYSWGVWVEIDEASFGFAHDHAYDLNPRASRALIATLANNLPDMPATIGLTGRVTLTGPNTTPELWLDADSTHPLVQHQQQGVHLEQVLDWTSCAMHADSEPPA